MKVNLAGVDSGFTPLPAGEYVVRLTDVEEREAGEKAKNPGSIYYNWTMEVESGEYAGRKLFTNTSLVPEALFSLKQLLEASERFSEEDLNSPEFDLNPEDLLGSVVGVKVAIGTYDGEPTNNIKRFKRAEDVKESGGPKDASKLPV